MSIGLIVATDQELSETIKIMKDIQEEQFYNLHFYEGIINEKKAVLVKSGIGKVNAARTTQILIDKFAIEMIINIGAAGGINDELNVNDIVIGNQLVQYDFDTSALGESEKGEIEGIGKFIKNDERLLNICERVLEEKKDKDFKVKIGTIASADLFCANQELAEQVREEFGAECVEMEGAAVAQVCFLANIPFLVIRGISDTQNGNNKIDYFEYCELAAKQAVEILYGIIKNI